MKQKKVSAKGHHHIQSYSPDGHWQDSDDLRWAVRHWAVRMGVKTPNIHIRAMKTKWASISTAGRLTLNIEILALPCCLGELVLVHELAHLLMPNHGKVFKLFLDAYMPDWKLRQQQLREHEVTKSAITLQGTL